MPQESHPPCCDACARPIGVYERFVLVTGEGAQATSWRSLRARPHAERGHGALHMECAPAALRELA